MRIDEGGSCYASRARDWRRSFARTDGAATARTLMTQMLCNEYDSVRPTDLPRLSTRRRRRPDIARSRQVVIEDARTRSLAQADRRKTPAASCHRESFAVAERLDLLSQQARFGAYVGGAFHGRRRVLIAPMAPRSSPRHRCDDAPARNPRWKVRP